MAINNHTEVEAHIKRAVGAESIEAPSKTHVSDFSTAYREIPGANHTDVLQQLRANITQLEELHGRMQFMMIELKGLVRK